MWFQSHPELILDPVAVKRSSASPVLSSCSSLLYICEFVGVLQPGDISSLILLKANISFLKAQFSTRSTSLSHQKVSNFDRKENTFLRLRHNPLFSGNSIRSLTQAKKVSLNTFCMTRSNWFCVFSVSLCNFL